MPALHPPSTVHRAGAPRLLITGGRGRLARLIADAFAGEGGCPVRLFSRRAGEGIEPLERLWAPDALAGGGVLLHLAWSSLPATAEQQPGLAEKEDLPLLRRLLAALQAVPAGGRPHLVFFSSGGAVYGNAPGRPNTEDDPCWPMGAYGRAKRAAEEIVAEWSGQTGAPSTVLRISNPYGFAVPQERLQGIIPHAIHAARTGTPLSLWGDGSARKDFLHHTDFLSALARIIASRPAGVFNLCRGESHSVNEVLAEVERQAGRPIRRTHVLAPAWDVHDSRLDNARLRRVLGWQPQTDLAEGIRMSLEPSR